MPRRGIGHQRRAARRMMVDPTDIIRDVETEDEEGYPRITPAVVATTRSWGDTLGASEQIVSNQAGYDANAVRYLPVGTDVRHTDRLQIGTKLYDIESIEDQGTEAYRVHIRVLVRSREQGGG